MRDRHSAGKTYAYMVTREKLPKPIIMKKGNVEYEIKYNYKIKACNLTSNEVKTMTGGALAMVGGKLTYTGKAMKGGSAEEEFENEEEEEKEEEEEEEEEEEFKDEGTEAEAAEEAERTQGEEEEIVGGKVGGKARSSKAPVKASAKYKTAKNGKVSKNSKELNKAKAKK